MLGVFSHIFRYANVINDMALVVWVDEHVLTAQVSLHYLYVEGSCSPQGRTANHEPQGQWFGF